ncbi:TonB-dependent receptor domain-containing protein [Campylobacter suis]|uniref:TonB-dependent receptor-like beta-barrel domain-containing protein n=1 Tax=Campylobacter suis TaxID=2790657 RepID=A0ABM8Q7T9_9BACT|nr:TonB-dependent receptor [Campylobacter suis]CAD7289047.1 hypothetical protein LMG8286_01632 [Campylobacter suis]
MINAHISKGNTYKDGDGERINFGYKRNGQNLVLGFTPDELSEYKFSYIHDLMRDNKAPQHVADDIETEFNIAKFDVRLGEKDLSNTLNLEFKYTQVDRISSSGKLRNSPIDTRLYANRKIFDINAKYDVDLDKFHNTFGIGYIHDNQDAKRYVNRNGIVTQTGYRFADILNHRYRVFDTLSYKFDEFHKLSLGLNYDWLRTELKGIDETYSGAANINSVRRLLKSIYGYDFDGRSNKSGLSGSLRYDFTPNSNSKYYAAFESLYRIGGNADRFDTLYGSAANANAGLIANALLKPERHNRINLGFDHKSDGYTRYLSSNGYAFGGQFIADRVDDLNIYDRLHKGNAGINQNATITRNVDAKIYTAKFYSNYTFANNFGLKGVFYYAYGQNTTDDRPLYQIRPFEVNVNFDYTDNASFGSYNIGTALRYVAKQTRGDWDKMTSFGIDKKEAAKGFTTLDIYSGIEFKKNFGVRLGINNLFDKKYTEFLSASNVGALDPFIVNAPGRTFWLSFHANF